MDQPTAEEALKRLEPLIGEWTLEAIPPGGEPWPREARATFEWHDSRAHVIQRSTVEMPEAPDGISIIGCDAANDTYYQLYSDDRGVCRVYEMSIGDGEESVAGGQTVFAALHRQVRRRRQRDRGPLGDCRGRRDLHHGL